MSARAHTRDPERDEGGENLAAAVEGFFAEDSPLSRLKPGYRLRPEQVRLALAVARTLSEASEKGASPLLLADAPTGTGKSFAALAPVIAEGKRAVISTATIALQHQHVEKDLPALAEAARLAYPDREPLTYGILKGRSNFLCTNRLDGVEQQLIPSADGSFERLKDWAAGTATGDREELTFAYPRWMEVAADAEDCVPRRCPHAEGCFYFAHRDTAQDAQVLIVNHSLLMLNLATDGAIFDVEGRHLIIDEAHQLPDVIASAFGAQVSAGRIRYVLSAVRRKAADLDERLERIRSASDEFFASLSALDPDLADFGSENAPPSYRELEGALYSVKKLLAAAPREELNALSNMVGRLGRDLESFYEKKREGQEHDPYAKAIVAPRRKNLPPELRSWLVEAQGPFREHVLERKGGGATVLLSATLADGPPDRGDASREALARSFGYARRRLGIGEDARSEYFRAGEAFDYENDCLVYVERELPEPGLRNSKELAVATAARVKQLLDLSGGRALVLCSTTRAVEGLKEGLVGTRWPVRFQGEGSPTSLVEWLKEGNAEEGRTLVATRTYWQGVDVPGPNLSLLVIDKVPFVPPDDPVQKRLVELAGKRWFADVAMPQARIALRQGTGRLLRAHGDRGVIALLDTRLTTRSWGRAMLASLPPAPTTHSLADVAAFFEKDPRGEGGAGPEEGLA